MTHTTWPADLAAAIDLRRAKRQSTAWPNDRYIESYSSFSRDVLDRELWSEQAKWVDACTWVHDGAPRIPRVSEVSGHKTGKTAGEGTVALADFATFDDIRVFVFAPKIEHLEVVLWPEIRKLYLNSGRCKACLAKRHSKCNHSIGFYKCKWMDPCPWCSPIGDASWFNEDPTKGLRSPDGLREIRAYTARDKDAMGGLSAPRMRFIFDEAGGIKSDFFEAMKGNSAGGVAWLMCGNPLHTSGEQYDAHHSKRELYTYVGEIDSRSTPNYAEGRIVVPGLATRDWVELMIRDWGEDSPITMVRIYGKYPKYEPGQMLRVDEVDAAVERWKSLHRQITEKPHLQLSHGRLQIGVDVAFTGDDATIVPRRGKFIIDIKIIHDTDPDALASEVHATAMQLKEPHEQKPIIVYDAQGREGQKFHEAIQYYAEDLELVSIYGNARPRYPQRFKDRRDELCAGLAAFVRRGGCIPPDNKLIGEILITKFQLVSASDKRQRIPTNDELRKLLGGRSPDRRDGCVYAVADVQASDRLGAPKEEVKKRSATRNHQRAQGDESGWVDADAAARAAYNNF